MATLTQEEIKTLQRQVKEFRLMRNKLMDLHIPIRVATAITQHGTSELKYALVSDFDQWSADVLAGKYDEELSAIRNIGPRGISQLKDNLRKIKPGTCFPKPEDHIAPPPAQPQPGPASKENKIAGKPSGVSFSIHVSDPYHAAALGHIADMLDGQIADRLVVEWLAYILDHFVDSNCVWDTEDDAVDGLIQAMEKTIKFLRTE